MHYEKLPGSRPWLAISGHCCCKASRLHKPIRQCMAELAHAACSIMQERLPTCNRSCRHRWLSIQGVYKEEMRLVDNTYHLPATILQCMPCSLSPFEQARMWCILHASATSGIPCVPFRLASWLQLSCAGGW